MTVKAAAFASLEQLLNQAIRLDPEALQRLTPLHGRVLRFIIIGLGLELYLIPEPGGIQLLEAFEGEPDCTLRGTPMALARMSSTRESADQLFSGAVAIEGDSGLAHRFGEFLSSVDIDWEEQLSRLTGDVIAHEAGNLTRGLLHWGQQTRRTLGQNLQEYLQEELRLLPSRYEIEPYLTEVDRVRDDTERLSARVERLQRRLAEMAKAQ